MRSIETVVIATRNKGKSTEISNLLQEFPVKIKNLSDFGPIPEVVEDGKTFEENAYKKASHTARILGLPTMADDSGLVVEALDGAPGIYSARYAGQNATDIQRSTRLLEEMEGVTNRNAAFHCVISIAVPTGPALTYESRCRGLITNKPQGSNGFGYDPIFYYPPLRKTFAQLTREEKSLISHRGKAIRELRNELNKVLTWIRLHMPVEEKVTCIGEEND